MAHRYALRVEASTGTHSHVQKLRSQPAVGEPHEGVCRVVGLVLVKVVVMESASRTIRHD